MRQRKNGFFTVVVATLLTITLSSCDNDKKEVKKETNTATETSYSLSVDGIGPINASSSFNMHQMTVAFNNYNVVEEVNYTEGSSFPVIRISEGVNTVLKIIPDAARQNIYSVIIEDNIIKNSLGHPLGTAYNKVYSYGQNEQCQVWRPKS